MRSLLVEACRRACVAFHLADCLANNIGECLKDLDYGAEAVYQFPIVVTILLEGLFSFMEKLEDRLGRV